MRAALLGWLLFLCGASQAALHPRDLDPAHAGHEAVYDDVARITWLADARADGVANYFEHQAWVDGLSVGGTGGWRLARTVELHDLMIEWRNASVAAMGWDVFIGGDNFGVDAGLGSSLFVNACECTYWVFDSYGDPVFGPLYDLNRLTADGGWGEKSLRAYAWAVHDGDIGASPAPEPASWVLLPLGLFALVWRGGALRRREEVVRGRGPL